MVYLDHSWCGSIIQFNPKVKWVVSNLRSLQKSHDLIVINENVATNDTTRREDLLYILVELRAAQSRWELGRGSAIHLVDFTPLFIFRDVHQLTRKTITPEQESKPRPRTCRAKQGNNIIRCRCLGFTCFMSAFYGSCQSEYTKSYFLTLVFFFRLFPQINRKEKNGWKTGRWIN